MKNILSLLVLLLTICSTQAQLKPVAEGSSVHFTIKNFGINTGGDFSGLQGSIHFDPAHPETAKFDVTADASSVNTGNGMRDNHLREAGYFDVKKYPQIHFVSTRVEAGVTNGFTMFGKLMIKDQTKDISFPFTATPVSGGYTFKGSFTINRKDFGIGGTSTISNSLEVKLEVVAKQ